MAEKKKKESKEKENEIDFGIGKLSFGGLFKGIGNLIDLASKLSEEAREIKKTGEIKDLGEKVRGVYGFSIRTMAGGEPVIESFGNVKETPKGPVVEEVREPIVDTFDEKNHLLIVAELPGVEKDDVSIEVEGDILILKAERGKRKYRKEILLPKTVDVNTLIPSSTLVSSFKNGILEIKLMKAGK
jgi:HSP20 family protein